MKSISVAGSTTTKCKKGVHTYARPCTVVIYIATEWFTVIILLLSHAPGNS